MRFLWAAFAAAICVSLAPAQVITTTIGTDWVFPSQRLAKEKAPLGQVTSVAWDPRGTGDLYVADAGNNMVMRITRTGELSVIAGNGQPSPVQPGRFGLPGPRFSGDGGPAIHASLSNPNGVTMDASGNLYIADTSNNRVRKVTSDGIITTVAGGGTANFRNGIPATSVRINLPTSVAVDAAGNLYVAETTRLAEIREYGSIYKITPAGTINDIGLAAHWGALAADPAGNVYSYSYEGFVRYSAGGKFDTFKLPAFPPTDGSAYTYQTIEGVAADSSGNLYLAAPGENKIYKATLRSGGTVSLTLVCGNGTAALAGDGGSATKASLSAPMGIAVDNAGNLYIADSVNQRVRRVSASDGTISTFAGSAGFRFAGDGGPASSAALNHPQGMAVDEAGNLFIADTGNHRIRKVTPAGVISTVAGNGIPGFSGDGGPATNGLLSSPIAVAVDASGNLYIADAGNGRIRKVSGGVIASFAGGGTVTPVAAGTPALNAFFQVSDVATDKDGNVFIATGALGIFGSGLFKVSKGLATPVLDISPNVIRSVAIDAAGNIYGGDLLTRIYKFTNSARTAIAGNGQFGFSGDGGPATNASLDAPGRMAFDGAGNLYAIDYYNNRVRKVDPAGIITSLAGGYFGQLAGDGGAAANAAMGYPAGLAVSRTGDVYVADTGNHRIRAVLAKAPSAQISTGALSFRAASGGGLADPQRITLQSAVPAMAFNAVISTQDGNWLSVQPAAGFTPATLVVTADPTGLEPGIHSGTITIHVPLANPASFTVQVSFNVGRSFPPQLSLDNPRLNLLTAQRGAAARGTVRVVNAGGGTLSFATAAVTESGASWLTITPASGSATPTHPAALTVAADPGGMAAGVYRGTVTVSSPDTGEQSSVTVTMVVNPGQSQFLLSQCGMSFQAIAGGGVPLPQNLGILNRGSAALSWTAGARVLGDGPQWLSLSDTSGTAARPLVDVSTIAVSVDPGGLSPGTYYGQVLVSANNASLPAQTVSVILVVSAAPGPSVPQIQPAGLVFTGRQGDAPGSRDVLVRNPSIAPLLFNSARLTLDGADWLQYIPQNANVPSAQPQRVIVQPGFAVLDPGVHDGAITFLFADGSIGVVRVTSIVAAAGCAPSRLVLAPSNLPQVFTATLNLPMPIEVQVVDDCGVPLTADRTGAAVTVNFSNGDRTINLLPTGGGFWTYTWQPGQNTNGPVFITVSGSVSTANGVLTGRTDLQADLTSTANVPVVSKVVNAASLAADSALAPGSLFTLSGMALAGGTVSLAGQPASVLMSSEAQINGQTPPAIPVNTEAQLTVQSGGAISVPQPVVIATAAPAIFTQDGSGSGAGLIADAATGTLNSPAAPAHTGDQLVIYCTGLGAPDAAVTVSIGGVPAANVIVRSSAALPGASEIVAEVPAGVDSGDTVPLRISVAGQTSPPVTLVLQTADNPLQSPPGR